LASGYRQITDDIREAIERGVYPAGTTIPTTSELIGRYKVSRTTVKRALAPLIAEGRLITNKRGGTLVKPRLEPLDWYPGTFEHAAHRRDVEGAGADAWSSDVKAQGRTPRQDVDVSVITASDLVTTRLGINPADKVVVRRRVRYVDDHPFQLADSYFSLALADGTPIMSPGDVTIPGGLMAAVGRRQVRVRDEISVRLPSPTETDRLELPAGTAVFEHIRTGWDDAGLPIRVMVTVVPGDRYRVIYEMATE
jgi:DNA-binding GntR family transcriptional regulator